MRSCALIAIGIASLVLALAYAWNGSLAWALVVTALGLLWLIGKWRDWSTMSSIGLMAFVGAAAFGAWLGLSSGWMLLSTVAALVAWDLNDFSCRLRAVEHVEGELQLKRSHLQRLLITASLGFMLGGVALGIEISLSFWWSLLLGALAIFALSQAFRLVRRESD